MTEATTPSHRARNIIITVIIVVTVIIAALFAIGLMQALDDRDAGPRVLAATSVEPATLPADIAFDDIAGHIVLDAVFAGSDDGIPFILDSGAPMTISDEVGSRFGGEVAGQVKTIAIDATIIENDIVPLELLSLGSATFRDVGAIQGFLAADNPLSCISSNGLIGANLMKNAVWQIDYDNGRITIASSVEGLEHIDSAVALEFTGAAEVSPSPIITIGAGDGELTFLLDTGSDGGLTVNPADLEALGLAVDADGPAYDVLASGSAGTYDARMLYSAVDLQLGALALADYPVATIDTLQKGQGNIGNGFLRDFVLTIDWPEGLLYLDPVAEDRVPPVPFAAAIGWDGQRIIVGNLIDRSDVATAGLKLGQPISAIDGTDVSTATREQFCSYMVEGQVEPFEITTDDGQVHPIDLVGTFYEALGVDA